MLNIFQKNTNKHNDEEKLRAAYSLNMCTVSVSQIVDYHDSYILEQEYDAILNNLNLKQMPKDEALLKIISELLNTVTFFRIQEIKKAQIEKKYQQKLKNAIWSAVPSLSVVVSGNPVAIALSLATQIGSGYMNYRKEKANTANEKEDAKIELEITAIEQLNALRRELFTTAWRLADEYDFDDEWRLTEKQIKQYDSILMDSDEYRKYARLESIADNFYAYPPFWYFYGHTANYIAEMAKKSMLENKQETDDDRADYCQKATVVKIYTEKAKKHYEHYYSLCNYTILREDLITAQYALEYIDILWQEEKKDIEKINKLIKLAEKVGSNSFDILQLCAISYLKLGQTSDAIRLLKILVNEQYNTSTNAKLLSRMYVSQFLFGNKKESEKAVAEYQILQSVAGILYLFPMPQVKPDDARLEDKQLQEKYIEEQKMLLQKDYRFVINEFIKSCIIKYNKIWPVPNVKHVINEKYFNYSIESREQRFADVEKVLDGNDKADYITTLRDSSFRVKYLDLLNYVIVSLDELMIFRNCEDKDDLVQKIKKDIEQTREKLKPYQQKIEDGSFSFDDYQQMQDIVSFQRFTKPFFDSLKTALLNQLENIEGFCKSSNETPMKFLETAEIDLIEFCRHHELPVPEESRKAKSGEIDIQNSNYYFEYSLLGEDINNEKEKNDRRKKILDIVKSNVDSLISGDMSKVEILIPDTEGFKSYFNNVKLHISSEFPNWSIPKVKTHTVAIIDDKTKKDYDLLLACKGFYIVKKNVIKRFKNYELVNYSKLGSGDQLEIGWPDKYSNKDVNIAKLYSLIQKIADASVLL